MRPIRQIFATIIAVVSINMAAVSSFAQDDSAQKAAEDIIRTLGAGQYKGIWDHKVSKWLQDRTTEDTFLASMSMARPALGLFKNLKLISSQHQNRDQATGFVGDIYNILYRTTYSTGEYYEQIYVVKDNDGEYRFAGIYGAPVPQN